MSIEVAHSTQDISTLLYHLVRVVRGTSTGLGGSPYLFSYVWCDEPPGAGIEYSTGRVQPRGNQWRSEIQLHRMDTTHDNHSSDEDFYADNDANDGAAYGDDEDDEHDPPQQAARNGGQTHKRKRVGKDREGAPRSRYGERHKSAPTGHARNPERARQKRVALWVAEVKAILNTKSDIKIDVLVRVILDLTKEERAELRATGPILQERYLAKRDLVEFLVSECFNALHAIDLRACEALPVRQMERMVQRLCCDAEGKRRLICEPPSYAGRGNPLTRDSNRDQGIPDQKKLYVPRIFPTPPEVRAAADRVLDGRRLLLAVDFDGAAWDVTRMAYDLLAMLAKGNNLIDLPTGQLRVVQLIYDGHGFLSSGGAVRFTLRSPHTKRAHNATCNALDPIFFIGTDKHAYLEKAVSIGGDASLRAYAYKGLEVTEIPEDTRAEHLPTHITENQDLAPLMCIR